MVLEVVAVCTLVAKIASIIGLFERIPTTYAWLKKVASTKWKKELDKYIKYLQVVKQVTRPYGTSNCSETSITGALQLLDRELTESWSKVDEWMPTTRVYKQFMAADFIKEMNSSKTTIHQNLQLFSTAVQTWEKKEGNRARPQTQQAVPHEGNAARPQTQQAVPQEGNAARPQTQQAVPHEYNAWLKKNITEWTVVFFGITCLVVMIKLTVIFFLIIPKWRVIFFRLAGLVAIGYLYFRLTEVERKNDRMPQKKKERMPQKKKEFEE